MGPLRGRQDGQARPASEEDKEEEEGGTPAPTRPPAPAPAGRAKRKKKRAGKAAGAEPGAPHAPAIGAEDDLDKLLAELKLQEQARARDRLAGTCPGVPTGPGEHAGPAQAAQCLPASFSGCFTQLCGLDRAAAARRRAGCGSAAGGRRAGASAGAAAAGAGRAAAARGRGAGAHLRPARRGR